MTCAKRHVDCFIITRQGTVVGSNSCRNPQKVCPRSPGEGYEKCISICGQESHAEIAALNKAEALGYDLAGATAIVLHWRVCDGCQRALRAAGIAITSIINAEAEKPKCYH